MGPVQPQIRPQLKPNKPAIQAILHQPARRLLTQHETLQTRPVPRPSKAPQPSASDVTQHAKSGLPLKPKAYWKKASQWDGDFILSPSKRVARELREVHADIVEGEFDYDADFTGSLFANLISPLFTTPFVDVANQHSVVEARSPVAGALSQQAYPSSSTAEEPVWKSSPQVVAPASDTPHSSIKGSEVPGRLAPEAKGLDGLVDIESSPPSVHMFQQAQDLIINGGEFYNAAGGINIDNSYTSINASTHPTVVTLFHCQHTLDPTAIPVLDSMKSIVEPKGRPYSQEATDTPASDSDNDCSDDEQQVYSQRDRLLPDTLTDHLNEIIDELEMSENVQSTWDLSAPSDTDQALVDDVILSILASYPQPPAGNLRLLNRVLQALAFSFRPLPPSSMAALLNFRNAQHLARILLPASPLVFVPSSEEDYEERVPVQFIHPSVLNFFLDRTRSGKYFINASSAHQMLLDGSTDVLRKVQEQGQWPDSRYMGKAWQDAYEYACRCWEAHRRAANKAKL